MSLGAPGLAAQRTENVVLIVSDGVRWQEVFRGAERRLISRTGGVSDTTALLRDFWREDQAQRRAALMPFLWSTIAQQGQLFGNVDKGSVAHIVNTHKFSYPGYNELFTGWFDERINSNEYPPNPNVTVFEWLAKQPAFRDNVAAIATWDAFIRIFNRDRAGFFVAAGWDEPFTGELARDARRQVVNEFYRTSTRYWPTNAFDAPMHLAAKEYIRARTPRVMFVGYGETDEWAHGGRYDLMLRATRQFDAYLADLWSTMQAMPQYRNKTTFIITTDHGRGGDESGWRNHGASVQGAEHIWIAVIGPDTPPLGERANVGPVTQSQVAATIAELFGLGGAYRVSAPRAAGPIRELFRQEH
jgi:hypothetical protein